MLSPLIYCTNSYICALPTIAIFGLQQKRFPFLIGALCFFGMCVTAAYRTHLVLMGPSVPLLCNYRCARPSIAVRAAFLSRSHITFFSDLIDALVFHCFLLYVHYMRENVSSFLIVGDTLTFWCRRNDVYIHCATSSRYNFARLRKPK